LRRIEDATAEILRPAQHRPLLVSCERSLAMRWLIPRLSRFQDAHPGLPVYLSTGGGPIDLARENVDLAIRRADFVLDPATLSIPLLPEFIGPVMHANNAQPTSKEIMRTRLHTTDRPDAWKVWNRHVKTTTHAPSRIKLRDQYFDHFFLSLQAAEAGLGEAIAPLFMVVDSLAAGTLVAPGGFIADGTQYVALLRKNSEADTPEACFLDWLREIADETMTQTRLRRQQ